MQLLNESLLNVKVASHSLSVGVGVPLIIGLANAWARLEFRGPVINGVAASFGGGGHALASGVRLKSFDDADQMIIALDQVCKEYNSK